MSFAAPQLLWLLLAPAIWLAWELSRRLTAMRDAHPKILRGETHASTVTFSALPPLSLSALAPRWRLALGLALAVTALARPQWGRVEEPVFAQSRDILLALDLSRSMLTEDVKPTRLARAKLLVQSLLEKLRGERVGLVVFSGTAFLQSPLSADYEILSEFLPALGPDHLPEGGTDYDALLQTAARAFGGSDADRFLIVLSDGEANDDSWKARVDDLKAKNIRVLGLGLGTAEGAIIPDGAGGFVKDSRGAVVLSRREDATLRALADATGGAYADASGWVNLAQLLDATVEQGRRGAFRESGRVRLVERFQWALAPALLLLAWSFWREFPVRPKPRSLRFAADKMTEGLKSSALPSGTTTAALLLVFLSPVSFLLFPSLSLALERTDSLPSPEIGRLVAKLAAADTRAARDWATLADATLAWGEPLKSGKKTVPEGPVRDALAAVAAGTKLDTKAADWPALRAALERLLPKPEEQKPPPPDQKDPPPQNQSQDQKNQGQSKDPNQSKDQNQSKDSSQSQPSPQNQSGDPSSPQDQSQPDKPNQPSPTSSPKSDPAQNPSGSPSPDDKSPPDKLPPPPSGQQSLGDMKSPDQSQPTPPASAGAQPGEMQQVGGVTANASAVADPVLAAQLQKLDQLRDKDSPVLLFQLMQQQDGTPKPPVRKDHNW